MAGRLTTAAPRRGGVAVLAAAMLVMIFAFAAFTVDLGYIALTRAQLQNAADAAALAACGDLLDGLGSHPVRTSSQAVARARQTARDVAASNRAGDHPSVRIHPQSDVEFGRAVWNAATGQWQPVWGGGGPYTAVRVTATRGASQRNDGLPLFFAPVIGHDTAAVRVTATAAVIASSGFRVPPGSPTKVPVIPFACDETSWDQLMLGAGQDDFRFNPNTDRVTGGSDGTKELNIYPGSKQSLPSGNRGTVSLAPSGSSTTTLSRWIIEGMNADDLAHFGGELGNDQCPLELDGVTGMKGGMEGALQEIIGQPRVMPLFSEATGKGTNSRYTIVRFVGVRIVDVELSGGNKRLIVQPASVSDETAVPGDTVFSDFYTRPRLID